MEWFMPILPQVIAALIVAAISGVAALMFNNWRRRRRIAQLRQVITECWDVLRLQEDMHKFLQMNMEGVHGVGDALLAYKKHPTPENLATIEKAFENAGIFITDQMQVIQDNRRPVAERHDRARDELSKLQSGLAD